MTTEELIRQCAARNLSRRATMEVLGVSRENFALMLSYMPDVVWPARNKSVDFCRAMMNKSDEGFTQQLRTIHQQAMAARRAQCLHTLADGRQGSIEEFRAIFNSPVSATAVRRRLAKGWTLEEALTKPKTRRTSQLNQYKRSGWQ